MSQLKCVVTFCLLTILVSLAFGQKCTNRYGSSNLGHCIGIDQCRGAAFAPNPGNCSNQKHICCVDDNYPKPVVPSGIKLTKPKFMKLVGNSARNEYLYDYVAASMSSAGLPTGSNSDHKVAAYLSQIVGETNSLRHLESNLTSDRDTDAYLGNNQPGDGIRFMGRGGILLRGRDKYIEANQSRTLNLGFDLLARPEQAAFPSIAFRIASWFWRENAYLILNAGPAQKGDLSRLVDGTFLNFTHLTHALTNNLQALKERAEFNDRALLDLRVTSMKRGQGVECSLGSERGYAVPICLADFQKPYCGCEGKVDMDSCPYGETQDGRCRSSSVIKCCVEKCSSSLDLVIAMDSSTSIGPSNFQVQKEFVKSLVAGLNLGKNFTQLGLINFNTVPHLLIDFANFTDYNTTADLIDNIEYTRGSTATHRALRMANEDVLQVERGMRPIESGTPRVVMVITDGGSDDQMATYREADRLKERGVDIVSVGIGEVDLDELIEMASSPDDQYFVEDFDKLSLILSELQKTTCQKPAEIPPQKPIKGSCKKHAYKYYRFNLNDNADFPRDATRFTVQLDMFAGRSELFHSFTNENPKSQEDYIDPVESGWEGNFIEKSAEAIRSSADVGNNQESELRSLKTDDKDEKALRQSFYQIERPKEGPNDVLYFSVRGLEDANNEFEVFVHNKTVNFSFRMTFSSGLVALGLVMNIAMNLFV